MKIAHGSHTVGSVKSGHICGGHAGRGTKIIKKIVHKNMKDRYGDHFPQINDAVYHCKERHSPGCGCLSEQLIEKARSNFSLILSQSDAAEMVVTKIKALAKHACDMHKWEDRCCGFHYQHVCSCNNNCVHKEKFECKGQDYHIRLKLTCPFHSSA